jgi:hypothetical protein
MSRDRRVSTRSRRHFAGSRVGWRVGRKTVSQGSKFGDFRNSGFQAMGSPPPVSWRWCLKPVYPANTARRRIALGRPIAQYRAYQNARIIRAGTTGQKFRVRTFERVVLTLGSADAVIL